MVMVDKFIIDKNFHGFGVEFSPFTSKQLACAASEHFGLKGQGCLYVLAHNSDSLSLMKRFTYESCLYDLTWSEANGDIIVTASNDGCLQLWNTNLDQGLLAVFRGHEKEVNSVTWSLTRNTQVFVSSSWDQTIKLWDPDRSFPIDTFRGHNGIVYCVSWSPQLSCVLLSSSGDGDARVWDMRTKRSTNIIHGNCGELLSCDWTKYEPTIFVTSGTDSTLRVYDLRSPSAPIFILSGHNYPARRIKCSPHNQHIILSASYDKTIRIWDYSSRQHAIQSIEHHSEFVTGIDFSMENPEQVVDCSWDRTIKVFKPTLLMKQWNGIG